MISTIIIVAFSLLLLVGLSAALLLSPLRAEADFRSMGPAQMEKLGVSHFVNCKQVSRALADEDYALVRTRLPRQSSARMRHERRTLVRNYVVQLGRDFARIDRLARIVASLSPSVNRTQEFERLRLELQFRCLYRLVLVRLTVSGEISAEGLARLANLVGAFARRVETAMTWKETPPLGDQLLGA